MFAAMCRVEKSSRRSARPSRWLTVVHAPLRIFLAGWLALQIVHAQNALDSDFDKRFDSSNIRYMGLGKRSSSEEFEDPLRAGKGFRMGFGKRSPQPAPSSDVDDAAALYGGQRGFHLGFGKRHDAVDAQRVAKFHMGFGKRSSFGGLGVGDELDDTASYMRGFRMGFGRRRR